MKNIINFNKTRNEYIYLIISKEKELPLISNNLEKKKIQIFLNSDKYYIGYYYYQNIKH